MKTGSAPPPARPTADAAAPGKPSERLQPVAREAQNKRFADQVVRADVRAGPGGRPERGGERPHARVTSDSGKQEHLPGAAAEDDELPGINAGSNVANTRAGPPGAARPDAAGIVDDQVHIERMAAAIAEVAAKGAEARYVVEFPPGLPATGAVIARDAAGALVLRIVGTDDRMSARASERMRAELADALSRRKLRVARIDIGASQSGRVDAAGR